VQKSRVYRRRFRGAEDGYFALWKTSRRRFRLFPEAVTDGDV
jgi:hypothetical protein